MSLSDSQLASLSNLGGDISELVAEVKRLRLGSVTSPSTPPLSPLRVGNNVLIRTVTMIQTGHIEALDSAEIVLSSAAWIADTGRFHDALRTGTLNEVEPFPSAVSVNREAIIDVTDWTHPLPKAQK